MKAYALTAPDQPAALVDLPDPEAPAGGVLIRVRAASVQQSFALDDAAGALAAFAGRTIGKIVLVVG